MTKNDSDQMGQVYLIFNSSQFRNPIHYKAQQNEIETIIVYKE